MKIQVSFPSHSLWATLFATVCFSQCCGSGSGRIDIILADPYPFQPNVKLKYFFPENVNMLFKLLKIWTPMTVLRKTMQTGTAVNESKKLFWFSNMRETRCRIQIRICIGIKWNFGSRSGSASKRLQFTTVFPVNSSGFRLLSSVVQYKRTLPKLRKSAHSSIGRGSIYCRWSNQRLRLEP
jgi:hypothetical protein